MLVSLQRGWVFIHVPKTAGTAITDALKPHADLLGLGAAQHATAWQLSRWLVGFAEMFSFAVVRNPWDAVHSAYHFARGVPHAEAAALDPDFGRDVWHARQLCWGEWLEWHCAAPRRSQVEYYCCDGAGRRLTTRLLRHDRLRDDWTGLCRRLQVGRVELPVVNVTPGRGDYRLAYAPSQVARVRAVYRRDIDELGFEFG